VQNTSDLAVVLLVDVHVLEFVEEEECLFLEAAAAGSGAHPSPALEGGPAKAGDDEEEKGCLKGQVEGLAAGGLEAVEEGSDGEGQEAADGEEEVESGDFVAVDVDAEVEVGYYQHHSQHQLGHTPADEGATPADRVHTHDARAQRQQHDQSPHQGILYRFAAEFSLP
jgi:hypothetical protein